jgi:hypothetical protein
VSSISQHPGRQREWLRRGQAEGAPARTAGGEDARRTIGRGSGGVTGRRREHRHAPQTESVRGIPLQVERAAASRRRRRGWWRPVAGGGARTGGRRHGVVASAVGWMKPSGHRVNSLTLVHSVRRSSSALPSLARGRAGVTTLRWDCGLPLER